MRQEPVGEKLLFPSSPARTVCGFSIARKRDVARRNERQTPCPSKVRRLFLAIWALGNLGLVACGGGDPASTSGGYSTTFDETENPISEGGRWSNNGQNWTFVQTANGIAYGTNGAADTYDDSYAYLAGFGANQQAEAVVYRSATLSGDPHEVELLLRWADSPGIARGYECGFSHLGAVVIVRWNGPFGNFTLIGSGGLGRPLVSGDVVKATIVGNLISVYVNGAPVAQASDSTWSDGQPGIGFFRRTRGASSDLGFASFSASSLP